VTLFSYHHGKLDGWRWVADSSGIFSIQSFRRVLSDHIYGDFSPLCTWEPWIPIKVNCFIWRLLQNRIPVAVNLVARGLNSILSICSFCRSSDKSSVHVFLECPKAKEVWRAISLWCQWRRRMNRAAVLVGGLCV